MLKLHRFLFLYTNLLALHNICGVGGRTISPAKDKHRRLLVLEPEERLIGWLGETYREGDVSCRDEHEHCKEWATSWKECTRNPTFMLKTCPVACGVCRGSRAPKETNLKAELSSGVHMPLLGLGVGNMPHDQIVASLRRAFDLGVELVDTAAASHNHHLIREAVGGVKEGDKEWMAEGS
ncbi:hypothetical protein CYMTET_25277 [Cymbomonas tetramitiformis]|uniref:ShKT domain-containing protein n=1 Tax=Cymbomonas tetramitiformis TaxID=36881 RepID=A0AAE0KZ26_9CHLO|nr:hypothetical protein CYMTET_25277 [Cymbomonas tetramitiformis]